MEKLIKLRVCPICGCSFTEHPAISRIDNETEICPDCGSRQALESIGVSKEEQEHILKAMHQYRGDSL